MPQAFSWPQLSLDWKADLHWRECNYVGQKSERLLASIIFRCDSGNFRSPLVGLLGLVALVGLGDVLTVLTILALLLLLFSYRIYQALWACFPCGDLKIWWFVFWSDLLFEAIFSLKCQENSWILSTFCFCPSFHISLSTSSPSKCVFSWYH